MPPQIGAMNPYGGEGPFGLELADYAPMTPMVDGAACLWTVTKAVVPLLFTHGPIPLLSAYTTYKASETVQQVMEDTAFNAKVISESATFQFIGLTEEVFIGAKWICRAGMFIYTVKLLWWGRKELGVA